MPVSFDSGRFWQPKLIRGRFITHFGIRVITYRELAKLFAPSTIRWRLSWSCKRRWTQLAESKHLDFVSAFVNELYAVTSISS